MSSAISSARHFIGVDNDCGGTTHEHRPLTTSNKQITITMEVTTCDYTSATRTADSDQYRYLDWSNDKITLARNGGILHPYCQ